MIIHKKQQIKTPSVMRNISIVSFVCMTSILSACTSMATDKSLCELKVWWCIKKYAKKKQVEF